MRRRSVLLLPFLFGDATGFLSTEGNGEVKCLLEQLHPLMIDGQHDPNHFLNAKNNGFRCFDENGISWEMEGLPPGFFENESLVSGETFLSISSAAKLRATNTGPNKIVVHSGATISESRSQGLIPGRMLRHQRRVLAQKTGDSTILVVRVTDASGDAPSHSASTMSQDIFSDSLNLASQMAACSNNQLRFHPATGDDSWGIINGVMEITVPFSVAGVNADTVESWAVNEVVAITGNERQWNHVLYVLPGSVNFGSAAAYAYFKGHRLVYDNTYASIILLLMHEMGHNLGLHHSGSGSNEYGDKSCFMGVHVYQDDAPRMCYNGPKSWELGWYEQNGGHATVVPGSWEGSLVGVDDYINNENYEPTTHSVVVKVEDPSSDNDLYLMYNRAKGINGGVPGLIDTVTVIAQGGSGTRSWVQAALTETSTPFVDPNWPNGTLVIEVCSRSFGAIDQARVHIYLDDGVNNLTCPTPEPTTVPPTLAPVCGEVETSCVEDIDCCSGSCSKGKTSERVCLVNGGGGGDFGGDGPQVCLAAGAKCNAGTCCSGECRQNKCL